MENPVIIATNANVTRNHSSGLSGGKHGAYSIDENTWFLNNISYIFEDDEQMQQEEDQLSYENVIIIDSDPSGSINNLELLSEKWQLLSFDQNARDNCISLSVMNELSADLTHNSDVAGLDTLAKLYHERNAQIRKLLDSISQ
ncbi:unnamed protein product [Kluyveromyces dobzhanskii CBS 2104]|uniref:WGS project CCBQ000000000 data, contig 00107 n=1 Tax=Kluyveromyces dobzhanskii CBS 2104 TaxID=1427455 RepID=A0A0A8L197_9SACH|nr:unnamed protein product [Kluyveromyces dobzhanskii CBS 2104]